ncbi:MAG: tRNA dihydrouridine synthase [Promethearchaeota archaeon]
MMENKHNTIKEKAYNDGASINAKQEGENISENNETELRLGRLRLKNDLILAPMMDVTTPSYISLIKYYNGLGLYILPMVFVNQIVAAPKTIRPWLEYAEEERPSGVQIVASGKSVEQIEMAMDILNSYEFDIIDINCGCPAKHTTRSGGGASLLKPHRFNDLQTLIKTTQNRSNKPVSIKIRIGWDSKEGLPELIRLINDFGLEYITVHGRYARQGYSGSVDYDAIKLVKDISNIPVIGNGDVCNYSSYKFMKDYTKVDAVMIGRASMGHPKIFSEIYQQILLEKSKSKSPYSDPKLPDNKNIKEMHEATSPNPRSTKKALAENCPRINKPEEVLEYAHKLLEIIDKMDKFWSNNRFKLVELRRNIIWALKGMNNSARVRERIAKTRELEDLLAYINSEEFITLIS